MSALMSIEEGNRIREAAGGSFERSALDAGLRVYLCDGLCKVGALGLEAGDADVQIEESEDDWSVECFTDKGREWLRGLAEKGKRR